MSDADEIDQKTATLARTKLHAMLDGNPSPAKVAEIHRLLGMLPEPNAGKPREFSDEQLGIENQPITSSRFGGTLGGDAAEEAAAAQPGLDAAAVHPEKPQSESDPMTRELTQQAMAMPLLHMIGAGIAGPARAVLESKGGRAAQLLKNTEASGGDPGVFNPDAIVSSGSMKGAKAGDAIEHLERLKANGANVERELENVYADAHGPTPAVEEARSALTFRPPTAYESVHALHGNPAAIASAGTHVIPPILGRLTVPAKIAAATGAGIATPASAILASPLMRAIFADNPQVLDRPELPAGGTK